jgi:2Fe-2S ferredoxin
MGIKNVKLIKNGLESDLILDEEVSLLQGLLDNDVDIDHSCGGMGTCGTCLCFVETSVDIPRDALELEMATERGFGPTERLACQIYPTNEMRLKIRKP